MTARRRAAAGLGLVVALLISACSGVPKSSPPQIIRPGNGTSQTSSNDVSAPRPGADPRSIVTGFLAAAVKSDARHSGSRQFLTPDASSKWKDGDVTTILSDYQVQVADTRGRTATVKVTGQKAGQLDSRGIFTPPARSSAAGPSDFTFTLRQDNGQWRIDGLDPGVLVSFADFQSDYNAEPLYFFDSTEARLVPDLRYTALRDDALGQWLLAQMLAGPRPELTQAVQNEIPDQVDPRRATIDVGDQITIDLPGTAQLDNGARERLAAQLAYSVGPQLPQQIVLNDAGRPVTIPGVGTEFSRLNFSDFGPQTTQPAVQPYYLNSGGLFSGVDGKAVSGPVGTGTYGLTAMALRRAVTGELRLVGLTDAGKLVLGPATGPLTAVSLPAGEVGPPTVGRPDWEPHSTYAWVGVGNSIIRIGDDGRAQPVPLPSGSPTGRIEAIRFSPDGVRVGLLFRGPGNTASAWVGSVSTNGGSVALTSLVLISAANLSVADLTWADSLTLLMVATATGDRPRIWAVQSDGSFPNSRDTGGLPRDITSIASAVDQPILVGTDGPAVWIQRGSSWASLAGSGQTVGESPAYAP